MRSLHVACAVGASLQSACIFSNTGDRRAELIHEVPKEADPLPRVFVYDPGIIPADRSVVLTVPVPHPVCEPDGACMVTVKPGVRCVVGAQSLVRVVALPEEYSLYEYRTPVTVSLETAVSAGDGMACPAGAQFHISAKEFIPMRQEFDRRKHAGRPAASEAVPGEPRGHAQTERP